MKDKMIKKITIEIAGIEIEVTPQQAKDLHAALQELLGLNKPTQIVEKEVIRDRWHPYWPYYYKTMTWPETGTAANPYPNKWTVTYHSTDSTAKVLVQ